jgi:hypothetical protein
MIQSIKILLYSAVKQAIAPIADSVHLQKLNEIGKHETQLKWSVE